MPTVRTIPASVIYQSRDSVTLENNTAKNVLLTVPAGKIWRVHAVRMHNGDDVSRDVQVKILDSSNNTLHILSDASLTASSYKEMLNFLPTTPAAAACPNPVLIKGGNKLQLSWAAGGTSSGGTAYYSITYEEVTA